jgi:hypothetical protein
MQTMISPGPRLTPIIPGVDCLPDRIFFKHYCFRLSAVLIVEESRRNPFKDLLLPIAVQHPGLMHSILALSGTHINWQEEYGKALLAEHPGIGQNILSNRARYHRDEALRYFNADVERQQRGIIQESLYLARYGQILCFLIQSIGHAVATGEHRIHLRAYHTLIQENRPDGPFMDFIEEFFQFHQTLDDLVRHPQAEIYAQPRAAHHHMSQLTSNKPQTIGLLGVRDGLFLLMSRITNLRNMIRSSIESGSTPIVGSEALYIATEIDADVREWQPSLPAKEFYYRAGILYKQMTWIYLWLTIYPPQSTSWVPSWRITAAVKHGIDLLASFPASDQVQTLLLPPAFVIGCAAFDAAHRGPVRTAIQKIRGFTGLKNADQALGILERIWGYMDKSDERSGDWQAVMRDMRIDFLTK